MKILIVGAGIGGLITALSLERAGFDDVIVVERAHEIRGLGVGINLLPHAVRELTELGVAEHIVALGVEPTTLAYYNRFGQEIWTEPRGTAAGYDWPQLSVHRGKLQVELARLVNERLAEPIRLGHRLVDLHDATAVFELPSGERTEFTADVIVGADGINSTARTILYPADPGPIWSGITMWRGTALVEPTLDGSTMVMVGDPELKFVTYPLQAPRDDGKQLVNFIAERTGGGFRDGDGADWNRAVDREPVAALFNDWVFDWIDVPAIVRASEEILEYASSDVEALPQWSFGTVTLLGDAAHAMYPNGSNGGSQATLDARTLAYQLATQPTVAAALTEYEQARRPLTTALLAKTRQTGPERIMALARERAPQGFTHVHDVISREELEEIAADYKRAAGFHPDHLHARSSLTVEVEGP
ncbi:flavin-dependent oxidoreductase [uncultured Gordonia sp.]|uniref:flavin-dependent oxidoreductase n=1 Tax=uncultured Gordonia sp. TaxID=198437 RepID=UPI000FABE8AA|nr:flavin-dependent oxidoreductase [uncultured Gordonia sp.]RUP37246.1 MAG: flavin-dependent oxidoreductase [Gordonia sp. (in: high G+C Gram-positive bacteria)]